MKIKIAILDEDKRYVMRLSSYFSVKFNDKVELSVFSDNQTAENFLKNHRIDVLLVSDKIKIEYENSISYTLKLYLSEDPAISEIEGISVICKYQKIEDMYKWIMQQYANHIDNTVGISVDKNDGCKNIMFCGYGNAAGATSLSIAFSLYLVREGYRVFYLNLEQLSSMYAFFENSKDGGFSDLLYSIKSNKGNTVLKTESIIRKHESGIQYINSASHPMDLMECNSEDITKLMQIIRNVSNCDYLIIDTDFVSQEYVSTLMKDSHLIIFADDGSTSSNMKFIKLMDMFEILEEQSNYLLKNKIRLIYNKFSSKSSQTIDIGIKDIGGHPNILHSNFKAIVEQLSRDSMMDKLHYESGGES